MIQNNLLLLLYLAKPRATKIERINNKSEASTVKSSTAPMLAPTCSFQALEPSEGAGTCAETKPAGKDTVVVDTVAVLNLGEDEHINVLTKPPRDWLKTNFIFDTS